MTAAKKSEGPLTAAASAFEVELERYERIAAELHRTEVSSEKTLSRSKKLLGESSECEQRLGALLGQLLQAMNGARETQQTSMQHALDAAQRLQRRADELNSLLARFAKLGEQAREVNEPVASIMAAQSSGASAEEILPALNDARGRMETIISGADAIATAAAEGNWPDLVREASALRDQVQASRNKLLRAHRDVAERAPS